MVAMGGRKVWSENFSEWFHEILASAEVYDYRYPVKGCGVWMPYGFKIRKNIIDILRRLLDGAGHEEVLFPMLIPDYVMEKESSHIKRFEPEVFWVTRGGLDELDVKLALRPTSETCIATMLKLWVRSHTDLPKKLYQVVSIFRYETKSTRPMVRVREVTTFKEAHTSHVSYEEAEKQVWEAVDIYKAFFDELCVPYIVFKRPDWDKFAGALYSVALDTIMPDGRTMQIGTSHNLGQNFSKVFDITFLKPDGTHEYIYQTCYGISERVVASVLALHGDDRGLILPPSIAPTQVVIIPIPYKGREEDVDKRCREVLEVLSKEGFKVHYDNRPELTPGSKFYYWELRGVPIRVEIGPKDVDSNTITLVRRDTYKRETCKFDEMLSYLKEASKDIAKSLYERAWSWLRTHVHEVNDVKEAKRIVENRMGVAKVPWCGGEECGLKIEEETGAKVLGVLIEAVKVKGKCPICGKDTQSYIGLAKAY